MLDIYKGESWLDFVEIFSYQVLYDKKSSYDYVVGCKKAYDFYVNEVLNRFIIYQWLMAFYFVRSRLWTFAEASFLLDFIGDSVIIARDLLAVQLCEECDLSRRYSPRKRVHFSTTLTREYTFSNSAYKQFLRDNCHVKKNSRKVVTTIIDLDQPGTKIRSRIRKNLISDWYIDSL